MTDYFDWNEYRVERLKKLWADGKSGTEIAKDLGCCSRNAVIGKVHRLGLPTRAGHTRESQRLSSKLYIKRQNRLADRQGSPPAPKRKPPAMPQPPDRKSPSAVKFSDISENGCRWSWHDPKSPDFAFCGKPSIPGHAWCSKHFHMVYVPGTQFQLRRRPEPKRQPTFYDKVREDA
jgi:GcrA cell cycle regulator